jgi:YHS domain-containing protein
MKKLLSIVVCAMAAVSAAEGPEFTSDGQMKYPQDYRQWVYLSSGIGMTYGPLKAAAEPANPSFDNVFVNRSAYQAFLQTGKWPDKTALILEVRGSQSKGSINKGGHFQADVLGVEAHVKNGGQWAFYGFDNGKVTSKAIPGNASCYECHTRDGAVDTTFVQFYPTLIHTAQEKGTYKLATATVETAPVAAIKDVVCGMEFNSKTAVGKSEYKGKTYYFDTEQCKDQFDASPSKYATR